MNRSVADYERNWAALAHASTLLTVLVGFLTAGVGSILLALIQFRDASPGLKLKYYSVFMLAILFSACMVTYLSLALSKVNATSTKGEILSSECPSPSARFSQAQPSNS